MKQLKRATNEPILVFVLSEASPVLAQRWIDEGKLPFLAQMARNGSAGRLQSSIPFITAQLLADLYTGRRAQQHGVFDYVQKDRHGRFKEVTRETIACGTIWDLAHRHGHTCGVVNFPLTWPPRALNGYMVSGQDSPAVDRSIASPRELYDQLAQRFGRYRLRDMFPGGRSKQDYLDVFPQEIDWQCDVLAELIATRPCDFFMAFFSATAMAQHYFWSDMEAAEANPYTTIIESVYRRLDAQLARLVDLAAPDTRVFVISECGSGPLRSGVDVNAWLHEAGFLHYRRPDAGAALGPRITAMALRTAKRRVPEAVKSLLARYVPDARASAEGYLAVGDIDWRRTMAYSRGKEGAIYVNVEGREPHGIVPTAGASQVAARIIEQLEALVDPETGAPAVTKVHHKDELYRDCVLPGAPDLIIEWRDGLYMPTEAQRGSQRVFGPRWRANMTWPTSGSHRLDGIFFARGPGISEGVGGVKTTTLDLFPTWLTMMDISVPDDLPGHALAYCCCAKGGEVADSA